MRTMRQSGVTLIEVMVSLVVISIGLLGLYRVAGTTSRSASTAIRFNQAQTRAQQIVEAIRMTSDDALSCLATTTADGWAACEDLCKATLGPSASAQA